MLPLTDVDQQNLLSLAREALEEAARRLPLSDLAPPEGALREKGCAFVTLRKAKQLRGCIGYVEPLWPLYKTVRECAFAAALRDPRFEPVTADELPVLRLEISVLSSLQEVLPDQIEVGRHGLVVSKGSTRGLLLPQVPIEQNWDRQRFLEETCLKAGLSDDAWHHGAKLQIFTAQVFGEPADLSPTLRAASPLRHP